MAGKAMGGEGLSSNLAGMSKKQLYDIMSQMKSLIEQNQQQARHILIQNPLLTKALFQAQIMLGMVQPPQTIPNIQPPVPQQPQQATPAVQQQPSIQASHSMPVQGGLQDQAVPSKPHIPSRKQPQNQPSVAPVSSSSSIPTLNLQSQPPMSSSHALQASQQQQQQQQQPQQQQPQPQPKGHLNPQAMSLAHSAPQPPQHGHQPTMPNQLLQQPLQTAGIPHLPIQPPLPPQPRPPSMPNLPHQFHGQIGPNVGFPTPGAPQSQLHPPPQPMFHSGTNKSQASMGPSFPQGQPPLPSQLPPQTHYLAGGGSHMGAEFSNQIGSSMQVDRGSPWIPGLSDTSNLPQLPGPSPLPPSQIGPGNQLLRPPLLTPEMERALLQQVMSLTPEQINLLPPEQKQQVLQLQQMIMRP